MCPFEALVYYLDFFKGRNRAKESELGSQVVLIYISRGYYKAQGFPRQSDGCVARILT